MIATNPFRLAALIEKAGIKAGEYIAYYMGYNNEGNLFLYILC